MLCSSSGGQDGSGKSRNPAHFQDKNIYCNKCFDSSLGRFSYEYLQMQMCAVLSPAFATWDCSKSLRQTILQILVTPINPSPLGKVILLYY